MMRKVKACMKEMLMIRGVLSPFMLKTCCLYRHAQGCPKLSMNMPIQSRKRSQKYTMLAVPHLARVVHLLQHLPDQLGGHQVILGRQHQHAGGRQLLRPQALPVPHKLPAEGLRAHTKRCQQNNHWLAWTGMLMTGGISVV